MATFSDIDYAAHLEEAKNAARAFARPGGHDYNMLRPIPEEENFVSLEAH